jgi:hypothetical protein
MAFQSTYKIACGHQNKHDAAGTYFHTKSRFCPQGFRFRPGIEFNPEKVASYAPHVQILMIGMQMEVQCTMVISYLDDTNCFQMYSVVPKGSRVILKSTSSFKDPPGQCIRAINALQGSPQEGRLWQDKAEEYGPVFSHQSKVYPSYYWRWDEEWFTQNVRTIVHFKRSSDSKQQLDGICSQLMSK